MTLKKGYGVSITPNGGSATLIGGVETQDMQVNPTHLTQETSGQTSPSFVSVSEVKPRTTFGTYQIAVALDLLGSKGVCLDGGASAGFEMYELDTDDCGAIKSGSTHSKKIIPNGRVIPRSLDWQQGADFKLTAEVIAIFDGTNLPVILTESISAPTGLADTERFALGEVKVGNLTIKFVQSITIDFQNVVEVVSGDGDPYPKGIDIRSFAPTITITCLDVGQFATANIALAGKACTQANSYIIARRRVIATETFSSGADSVKIPFAGVASVQSVSGQANQPKQLQIMVTTYHDGTNDPIVIETDYDLVP